MTGWLALAALGYVLGILSFHGLRWAHEWLGQSKRQRAAADLSDRAELWQLVGQLQRDVDAMHTRMATLERRVMGKPRK